MLSLCLLLEVAAQGVLPPPKPLPAKVIERAKQFGVPAVAPKILFVNFGGAILSGGTCSSAPDNCSEIVIGSNINYPAFSGTDIQKQEIIDNLGRYYADFNIQIVTQRPASGHYAMIMIGGTPDVVGQMPNYLGIGPLDCSDTNPDDITFVWSAHPALHNDPHEVSITAAQEAAHAYGLGHTNDTTDIMYPVLVGTETAFQNHLMTMPNDGSDCTGTLHQNSYQLMMANVGPSAPDMVPPTISMVSPADGATLPSGFDAQFMASDNRVVAKVELWANGAMILSADRPPYKFTVPAGTLPAGMAKLKGVAYDLADNTGETPEITVTVKALGQTPGDLGTSCNDSSECNGGGYCVSDSGKSYCTRACNATSPCPSGFNCTQTPQFTSICSPQPKADDSGCSTAPARSNDFSAGASLLMLCALALVISRRRA